MSIIPSHVKKLEEYLNYLDHRAAYTAKERKEIEQKFRRVFSPVRKL